jgi:hypothetical protein
MRTINEYALVERHKNLICPRSWFHLRSLGYLDTEIHGKAEKVVPCRVKGFRSCQR